MKLDLKVVKEELGDLYEFLIFLFGKGFRFLVCTWEVNYLVIVF